MAPHALQKFISVDILTPRDADGADLRATIRGLSRPAVCSSGNSTLFPNFRIESLDHEAHGIARAGGKVVFVEDALPGELVEYSPFKRKPTFDVATATRILEASFMRVAPRCPHFGQCGGCNMQHADPASQVAVKQRILEDNLARLGKVSPGYILPAIHGPSWGYRERARMSVRLVLKKGGMLVGFHERRSSYVAEMSSCAVLPAHVSDLIVPLRTMLGTLDGRDRMPQIELAVGDAVTVLVLRHLEPLSAHDQDTLRAFADRHAIQWWLQPKGPATAHPFHPLDAPELAYRLPEFGLTMPYRPTEFTQVNGAINRMLVSRAMRLLAPRAGERIADMFCGLGNFTLAIARSGASVVGIEGSRELIERARENALRNGLSARTEWHAADLFAIDGPKLAQFGHFDAMLIDPPRDGALELVKSLPPEGPRRIVYVSCSPATLARDAGILVHTQGFELRCAGVVNMFPHTAHVESIALFERPEESDNARRWAAGSA